MTATKTILCFTSEDAAWLAAHALEYLNLPYAVSGSEQSWVAEVYDDGALTPEVLADLAANHAIAYSAAPRTENIPDIDWVAASQSMLAPVKAGRFIVHGSHDRDIAQYSKMAIEIDAGRAFGTAHHASTLGCLLALDLLLRKQDVQSVLDLGTGSGVLAIAAAKAGRHRMHGRAIDIDPVAVEIAKQNIQLNGVSNSVTAHIGDGRVGARSAGRFDLVIANILARPLVKLAYAIAASTQIGGFTILAGFTNDQSREVVAAYLNRRYRKHAILKIEGWTTAVLQRV